MSQLTKTPSEINLEILSHALDGEGNINIVFTAANPYSNAGSIGTFEFSDDGGSTWESADIASSVAFDTDSFAINPKSARYTLPWSAIDDLWFASYTDVRIRLTLWDRANQSGRETATTTYTIGAVDFSPSNITVIQRPMNKDPYLDFQFLNTELYRPVRTHFVIELDGADDFSSIDATADSEADQTDWQSDGGAFPSDGIDGSQALLITCDDAAFDALANQDWYWRIRRVIAASDYQPTFTTPEQYDVIPEDQTVEIAGGMNLE